MQDQKKVNGYPLPLLYAKVTCFCFLFEYNSSADNTKCLVFILFWLNCQMQTQYVQGCLCQTIFFIIVTLIPSDNPDSPIVGRRQKKVVDAQHTSGPLAIKGFRRALSTPKFNTCTGTETEMRKIGLTTLATIASSFAPRRVGRSEYTELS